RVAIDGFRKPVSSQYCSWRAVSPGRARTDLELKTRYVSDGNIDVVILYAKAAWKGESRRLRCSRFPSCTPTSGVRPDPPPRSRRASILPVLRDLEPGAVVTVEAIRANFAKPVWQVMAGNLANALWKLHPHSSPPRWDPPPVI